MIVQADIRTEDGRVNDTLWVTDRAGHKITAEDQLRELRLSLILIEHFSRRLHRATNPEAALVHFSRFASETMARPAWAQEFAALDQPEVLDALVRVLGESDFLWEDYLHARPEDLLPMVGNPAEWRRRGRGELVGELQAGAGRRERRGRQGRRLPAVQGPRGLPRRLPRDPRPGVGARRHWPKSCRTWPKCSWRRPWRSPATIRRDSLPRRADGRHRCRPRSSRLGKFGGRELGFASDLELILVYDDRSIVDVRARSRPGPRLTVWSRPCGGSWPAARDRPSSSTSGSAPTAARGLRPRRCRRSPTTTGPMARRGATSVRP